MDANIQKWLGTAQAELARLGSPLPVQHVLAIVKRESNGVAGAVNPTSGASGLMQVMPVALKDYNKNHSAPFTMSDLRGKDQQSAQAQIRVGTWILNQFVRSAYKYLKRRLPTVSLNDLVRVADTFYAAGPGNARKRLDQIVPTWDNIKSAYPDWDRIKPAELIWDRSNEWGANWDLPAIDNWLESNLATEKKRGFAGAAVAIMIILIAWQYFKRKG